MGVIKNIGFDEMPKQGSHLGKRTKVCFNYKSDDYIYGTVIRDDVAARIAFNGDELPGHTIILLDDGRALLTTECQYSPLRVGEEEKPCAALKPDPQSIGYDMAYAPFNQPVFPYAGNFWFRVDYDRAWVIANRIKHTQDYAEDTARYNEYAAKHDGKTILTQMQASGNRIVSKGIVLSDSAITPYSDEFIELERERKRKRKGRVWQYELTGYGWVKFPRDETKEGRAILEELYALDTVCITKLLDFPNFIMQQLGLYNVRTEDMRYSGAIETSEDIWISIPADLKYGVNLNKRPLVPVNYSAVVMAQENDLMRKHTEG